MTNSLLLTPWAGAETLVAGRLKPRPGAGALCFRIETIAAMDYPEDLVILALGMKACNPDAPARIVLNTVMRTALGRRLKSQSAQDIPLAWLGPRGRFAPLLRDALAPEIGDDFAELLEDCNPEVRQIFLDLWLRAVVQRFGLVYLDWTLRDLDAVEHRFHMQIL